MYSIGRMSVIKIIAKGKSNMKNSAHFKRIFSTALAALISVSAVCGTVNAAYTPTDEAAVNASATIDTAGNILNNGGFETGDKASWINEDGAGAVFSVSSEDSYNGKYSLKHEKPADITSIIKNYCYYVEADAVYTVSYSYKITEGSIQVLPVIGQYTENWKQTSAGSAKWYGTYARSGVSDSWTRISFDITTAPETEILEFCLAANAGAGISYFDDVAIVKKSVSGENIFGNGDFSGGSAAGWSVGKSATVPAETEKVELISNGDFSNGFNGWQSRTSNTEIIEEDGKNILKMTVAANGNEHIQTGNIALEQGKTYTLTFRLKTESRDGNEGQCRILAFDPDETAVMKPIYKTYGRWKEYTAEYTAKSDTAYFFVQHNSVEGVSYWSDISLSYERTKTYTKTYDVMSNGDIERGAYAWNFGKSNAGISNDAHSGSNSLKYDSASSGQKYFYNYGTKVENGRAYTLSYYFKTDGDLTVNAYVENSARQYWSPLSGTQEWTLVTKQFTATADGNLYVGFQFQSGSGTAYIDDISVTYTEEFEYQPTVTEGVGEGFGYNGVYGLMVDTATEFWNYSTKPEEGRVYTYSMYIKAEDTESGFEFIPYINNFSGTWLNILTAKLNGNSDWKYVSYTFTAPAPHESSGIRFGFVRKGVGKVYISNVSLIASSDDDEINETMLSNGNFAAGLTSWELNGLSSYGNDTLAADLGITGNGALINHSAESGALTYKLRTSEYIPVEKGNTYIVKASVKTTGSVLLGASLRANSATTISAEYKGYQMSGTSDWQTIIYKMTVPADIEWNDGTAGVKLQLDMGFENTAATVCYDNIQMYREYAYGDANGDGSLDIKDLVRYKKYLANSAELASEIYADVDDTHKIDLADLVKFRKYLIDSTSVLGPVYFK